MWSWVMRRSAAMATLSTVTTAHLLGQCLRLRCLGASRVPALRTVASIGLVSAGLHSAVASSQSGAGSCDSPVIHQGVTLLGQDQAIAVDVQLMQEPGFCLEQLMELAGLSVAAAFAEAFPLSTTRRVIVVCGPGNNGGDGLVAARHLRHFGYDPVVLYPKSSKNPHFDRLVVQCTDLAIPVHTSLDEVDLDKFDAAVDAIFGFSFRGAPRAPFDEILSALKARNGALPVLSVDIPSGWHVEGGDPSGDGLHPEVLVSLTAPKKSAVHFQGRHFLGGRFVPPKIQQEFQLQLPAFPGVSQVVELKGWNAQTPVRQGAFEGSLRAVAGEEYAVVWITAPAEEAKTLASTIVSKKLAACVNIVPSVQSVYFWEGKAESEEESLMMVKTRASLLPQLTNFVAKIHSYDVPETIAATIVGGNAGYLKWVSENTIPPPATVE
uniref:NAD(P)H-hydrate epimerase n=1 Tax=Rhizochromulina marina TaxID=1034831 RepID=A0A7S2S4U9_9STRA|mmetsp:Transcript_25152/g.73489  ORF Transcript_25152/g.73489 Transcript_25152/m.73489 type:complete len:437 (+) Transcript_25152:66-1376(+)